MAGVEAVVVLGLMGVALGQGEGSPGRLVASSGLTMDLTAVAGLEYVGVEV